MKYAKIGLCEGRHQMPVEEYIFPQVVENPFDFHGLEKIVHEKLKDVKELDLYVSGLTPVLVTVINYCVYNAISLTLYHYDINSGKYVPQKLIIRREKWVNGK